jgi:extracellular factor (EF) 3-hydroxypalmitic acid methyl ester biosynthesis protein
MSNLDVLYSIPIKLADLFEKNGPDHHEYDFILKIIDQISADEIDEFRAVMQPILNPGTIIGFSFTKPFGYNGDFFIIEKIYQRYVSPDVRYKKWDEFFHHFPAAIAVVNRKKLAIEILSNLHQNNNSNNTDVLILGSGPVTEVYEFHTENPHNHLVFDLVDLDKRAIAYAKAKNKNFLSGMSFHNVNVIRHVPEKSYDLIWSAGLFDYFRDKHFVYLLKKYYEYVKPGGEMIIGNFNVENPSRRIMEILGDWFLNHRSEDELMRFALQAGISKDNIEVIREPLGINLFLKVRK